MANYTTSQRETMLCRLQKVLPTVTEDLYRQLQQQKDAPTLLTIERLVQRALKPIARELVLELVSQTVQPATTDPPVCTCGQPTEYEHDKPLTLLTMWDELTLERPYFSCLPCHHGTVPLDQALRIGPGQMSPAVEEALSMLGACMPFELATKTLRKLLALEVPAKTAQRVVDRVGREIEQRQQAEIQRAWEHYEFPALEGKAPDILYVEVDGTTIRLGAEYHEVKVGAFHRAELRTTPQGGKELHAIDVTYLVAVNESAEAFAKRVLVEGYRRGWDRAKLVVVLGDGAAWIWKHIAAQVPDAVKKLEIVDFYHASEHLWAVGKVLWGEKTAATTGWVEGRLDELLHGQVATVLDKLERQWVATGMTPDQLTCLGRTKLKTSPNHAGPFARPGLTSTTIRSGCITTSIGSKAYSSGAARSRAPANAWWGTRETEWDALGPDRCPSRVAGARSLSQRPGPLGPVLGQPAAVTEAPGPGRLVQY
jgi:hypothetical protein